MTRRFGTGLLIGLAHLALVAALLHHARSARPEDPGVVEYMSYVVIPKASAPAAKPTPAPVPPVAVRRVTRPAVRTEPAPAAIVTAQPRATDAAPAAAPITEAAPASPSPSPRLDMAALRAEARRLAGDHVPEPFEQVREAERRLEADKKDLGRAIREAKRPPCTKKYSGGTSMNLLALIPLAIDTITDTGCKW
ncbi:MAG: hypothetical protein ACRYGO_22165 [Janthinobacterium lividum]